MICGHGSRDTGAVAEFNDTVAMIRERLAPRPVESGFLEFARPIISEGLGKLRDQGVRRIDAVPGMLFAAGHVKNDVPSVLNQFAHDHEGLEVRFGRDLGIEPRLLELAKKRIEQALADRTALPREDTLLAVIGRGTSDSDANGNIAKVARMLWEGLNFPHAVVGFSGVAHPRVDACLQQAVRLGFKRIIVFPYFLFTGVLVRRIYTQTDEVAASYPEVEFVKAPYLGVHNLVVDSFIDRINGIESGDTNMNCGLCKYRTQIIGFESAVGAPQVGHHHHVEGIGTDHDHGHDHGHHHHHDHKPREH